MFSKCENTLTQNNEKTVQKKKHTDLEYDCSNNLSYQIGVISVIFVSFSQAIASELFERVPINRTFSDRLVISIEYTNNFSEKREEPLELRHVFQKNSVEFERVSRENP